MWRSVFRGEAAQDTFEYVLVIGIVVALVVAGLMAFDDLVAGVLGNVCDSVDTAEQAANCVNN